LVFENDQLILRSVNTDLVLARFEQYQNVNILDNISFLGMAIEATELNMLSGGLNNSVSHEWHDINLNNQLNTPVVLLSAPTFNGGDGGVLRMNNLSDSGFKVRFQEWDYLDGSHTTESVDYLALEPGSYTMADGTIIEVGTFEVDETGVFDNVSFKKDFTEKPFLFLTMQSYNGTQAANVIAKSVSNQGFKAAIFEQESLMDGHASESIAYVAILPGSGSGNYRRGSIETPTMAFSYELQYKTISHTGDKVLNDYYFLVEEQSKDDELDHVYEGVNALEINGRVFIQQITSAGQDTVSIRRQ